MLTWERLATLGARVEDTGLSQPFVNLSLGRRDPHLALRICLLPDFVPHSVGRSGFCSPRSQTFIDCRVRAHCDADVESLRARGAERNRPNDGQQLHIAYGVLEPLAGLDWHETGPSAQNAGIHSSACSGRDVGTTASDEHLSIRSPPSDDGRAVYAYASHQ